MASQTVPPLRIHKGSNGSPNKLPMFNSRPLSELSPMAVRRNSPSFPQSKSPLKSTTSPQDSSPFGNSPRAFWQGRDVNSPVREINNPVEAIPTSPPAKRSSIENLKKASRVKNSSMFAREQTRNYDPSRPNILDGRPLSVTSNRSSGLRDSQSSLSQENKSSIQSPLQLSNDKPLEEITTSNSTVPLSSTKGNASPTKSSISKRSGQAFRSSAFDPETGIWEDENDREEKKLPEGKYLHRHAKSVTFDQAPPQVNEYEMTTPDPSSIASGSREGSYESGADEDDEEFSFERGSSMDHDDSFDASLEDTEKTPVVMPEDWRFMSPDAANSDLARHEADVFDEEYGSPAPNADPGILAYRLHQASVNSVDSNGERRPLPPLPPGAGSPPKSPGRDSLSGALERMSNSHRHLPSPPQAAMVSKSEIRRMSGSGLSLNDRLKLMISEKEQDAQRERRMRRADATSAGPAQSPSPAAGTAITGEPDPEEKVFAIASTHFSRDSILHDMRSGWASHDRGCSEESVIPSNTSYDPDVPIPSMEDPTIQGKSARVVIKHEEDDEDNGLYTIPDMYNQQADDPSEIDQEDLGSQYSQPSLPSMPVTSDDGQITPRALSPAREAVHKQYTEQGLALPDFMADFGKDASFNSGLESFMTPPSEELSTRQAAHTVEHPKTALPDLAALRHSIQRPSTPLEQLRSPQPVWESDEPGTPSSVVRHATTDSKNSISPITNEDQLPVDELQSPSDATAAPQSTEKELPATPAEILASKSPFQARADGTEAVHGIKSARVSSLVQLEIPKDQSDECLSFGLEKEFDRVVEAQKVEFERSLQRLYYPFNGRFPSNELPDTSEFPSKSLLGKAKALSQPNGARHMDSNFANRASKQQRGYLMRQNTKVVVATARGSQDENRPDESTPKPPAIEPNEVVASPRKTSQPTWTAEPWNGKSRRKSIRVGGETPLVKRKEGPIPPLPGQASAVDGLGSVTEDDLAEEEAEDFEDGTERGRLFVKVIGVKDLQLPFPQHERTSFALTLDNGLHCVTTAWLDLARDAPIGQEFELVVLNDLEFQLTLQMKLEEPKVQRPQSPSKPPTSPKKNGAFGRFFGSPKKKEKEAPPPVRTRPVTPPSFYEMVQGLVSKDGSFARGYVNLSEHEKKSFGRPYSVDIKCFNEWAMEEVSVGSHRSKRGVTSLQRRPPYEIGKLELLLLYVPKPKGAKDEDMPKSMNGAVRAMREAEERMQQQACIQDFEGHLSQQGGDCPYWRRRFFKLVGTKLTAYHEATRQPRATINLAKAAKLIDDKSSLTQKETSTKGGGRRRSAFAEEEEGYMFIEEGFRIRFANAEVIDFYADSRELKEEWMKALSQVVGNGIAFPSNAKNCKAWTEMVLKREKSAVRKQIASAGSRNKDADVPVRKGSNQAQHHSMPASARPKSPVRQQTNMQSSMLPSNIPSPSGKRPVISARQSTGHMRTESYQPVGTSSSMSGAKSQNNSPMKSKFGLGALNSEERRRKARSMLM